MPWKMRHTTGCGRRKDVSLSCSAQYMRNTKATPASPLRTPSPRGAPGAGGEKARYATNPIDSTSPDSVCGWYSHSAKSAEGARSAGRAREEQGARRRRCLSASYAIWIFRVP